MERCIPFSESVNKSITTKGTQKNSETINDVIVEKSMGVTVL